MQSIRLLPFIFVFSLPQPVAGLAMRVIDGCRQLAAPESPHTYKSLFE